MHWLMTTLVPFYGFMFTKNVLTDLIYTFTIVGLFAIAGAKVNASAWVLGLIPISALVAKIIFYAIGSDSTSRRSFRELVDCLSHRPWTFLFDGTDYAHQLRTSEGDAVVATKHIALMIGMAVSFVGVRDVVPENDFPVGLVRTFIVLHAVTLIAYLRNQSECEIRLAWNGSLLEYDWAYGLAFGLSLLLFVIAWIVQL